jgi:hypothetical protein
VIEEAVGQHHPAIGIGFGRSDQPVHVGLQRSVETVLRRHAKGVGQHRTAQGKPQHGPYRRRRDQAGG